MLKSKGCPPGKYVPKHYNSAIFQHNFYLLSSCNYISITLVQPAECYIRVFDCSRDDNLNIHIIYLLSYKIAVLADVHVQYSYSVLQKP